MAGNKNEEETEASANSTSPEISELSIKHPLNNCWTLWYYETDRKRAWEENLKEITSFDTVEDFWSLYNHIKSATELKLGSDYYLFKKGIRPMWEDEANVQGGRWLLSLDKRSRDADLDDCWLDIILCMVGEGFEENSDEICGVTLNIRPKADKIGLWTANGDKSKADVIMGIGRKMKERLKLPHKLQLVYQLHKDSSNKAGSSTKNTFSL